MGNNQRKINSTKEAIQEIGKLEEKNCEGCQILKHLKKEEHYTKTQLQKYCMYQCKVGKKIREIGGIMDYGVIANSRFKAPELTKEKYIELRDEGKEDKDIRDIFGISRVTLFRRKQNWDLTKVWKYSAPGLTLKELTKEELEDLSRSHSDSQIAEMYNVAKLTVQKRRKMWGIEKEGTLSDKFNADEYEYLAFQRGLKDIDICKLWNISPSSILKLKKEWGIPSRRNPTYKELEEQKGLTAEKMRFLVNNYSDEEIARKYGLRTRTVLNFRKSKGIYREPYRLDTHKQG